VDFKELVLKNRSYRRFDRGKIATADLKEWVANVRLVGSPANLQPLKFVLVNREEENRELFPLLKWAAYMKAWPGPAEGERPVAYIIILGNRELSAFVNWDYGIALQTILLSAVDRGYGGCAVASCDKDKIRQLFDIEPELEIGAVVALGKPGEEVVIDEVKGDDVKYWRDESGIHHVPKRSLDDLIYRIIE
jgi:nitroreductase